VIYADSLARDLMESDPALRAALISAFGSDAYMPDGTLNRAGLAQVVFGSREHRKRMNAIVHPFVFQGIDNIIETDFAGTSEPYVLVEAALIYESGLDRRLDAVLFVDAPMPARVERISQRDGLSPSEIRKRIESQESARVLRKKADFVLDNIGDMSEIRPKVCFLDSLFRQI